MGNELQLLVESIPAHVVVTTPSGDVETVNRPTLEYFGKTFEELKDWATSDIIHPDDLQHTIAALQNGLEAGRAYNVESRYRRADGVYRWFNVLGLPLLDGDGRILRWLHLMSDIDDRKRAEEVLRASENDLREIINSIPGQILTLSPAGEIQTANKRMLDYFGMTLEEFKNWRFNDVIHPDDLPEVIVTLGNSLTSGTPYDVEYRIRRADGVYRRAQAWTLPLRSTDGKITRWYGLIGIRKRKVGLMSSRVRHIDISDLIRDPPPSGSVHRRQREHCPAVPQLIKCEPFVSKHLPFVASYFHGDRSTL
jgi:PAS domain S-box-containing protein